MTAANDDAMVLTSLPSPFGGRATGICIADWFLPKSQLEWDQLKACLLIEQEWLCAYCHRPLTWKAATFDHVIPRCQEGTDHRANIAMACQPCNSRKGGRSVLEWHDPDAYSEMLTWGSGA